VTRQGQLAAGIDEAGRGPLAGPVYAAAVVLPRRCRIKGLADSKSLTPRRREALAIRIERDSLYWSVARAEVGEIDAMNILQATLLAMQRAFMGLAAMPELALVDGNRAPALSCDTRAIVCGDVTEPCISAASVLAKVYRDREMIRLDVLYPDYDFANNKGYATPRHLQALDRFGASSVHRRSFAPVRAAISQFRLFR